MSDLSLNLSDLGLKFKVGGQDFWNFQVDTTSAFTKYSGWFWIFYGHSNIF